MGTRIRLRRTGKKKQAYYRVVVADSRSPRDGRFIEVIGNYNPKADPPQIEISEERVLYWLTQGAKPTDTVRSLLSKKGILAKLAKEKPEHAVLKRPPKRMRPGVEAEQPEPVSTEATPDVVEEAAQPVEPDADAPGTAVAEEVVAQEEPVEDEPESPPEEEPTAEEPESPPEEKPAAEE